MTVLLPKIDPILRIGGPICIIARLLGLHNSRSAIGNRYRKPG